MLNTGATPIANFVQKTFQILRSEQYQSVISWLSNGREFIIKESDPFENYILPKYFRHRNVNSFIRQLNMYGFHKSRREPNKLIFSHPYFLQARDDLLTLVRRKLKNQEKDQRQDGEQSEHPQNKYQKLNPQPTKKINFELIEREMADESTATGKTVSKETIFEQDAIVPFEQGRSIFAINSFFNIDYESIQMKNFMCKSYIFDNSREVYQRIQQGPSLKEIGTEQYLSFADKSHKHKGDTSDLHSLAIRLFETKNCMLQLDI